METDVIPQGYQVIIPSYQFQCCGNITHWHVLFFQEEESRVDLELQVWRPSPTATVNNSTGHCYSNVGKNLFTSVLSDDDLIAPEEIEFLPGDVVGFRVLNLSNNTDHDNSIEKGVVVLNDIKNDEEVWFARTGDLVGGDSGCFLSVGSNGILNTFTTAAPIISVSVSK